MGIIEELREDEQLGGHTDKILQEPGFDPEAVASLRSKGVV
jgi:crotonobetainyl-CoA:carnitine CoA-transferase CaiB-like acyl-CoA transferase